jgi:hypothetical protein
VADVALCPRAQRGVLLVVEQGRRHPADLLEDARQ